MTWLEWASHPITIQFLRRMREDIERNTQYMIAYRGGDMHEITRAQGAISALSGVLNYAEEKIDGDNRAGGASGTD